MPLGQIRNRHILPQRIQRATFALNAASNFLRDFVICSLHRLKQSRTLHTLTAGPKSGVLFTLRHELRHDCRA